MMAMTAVTIWFLRLFTVFRDMESLAMNCAGQIDDAESRIANVEKTRNVLQNHLTSAEADVENLRAANEKLQTEKTILEDRLESSRNEADTLWSEMRLALDNERYATRSLANMNVAHRGGGNPYPDAHMPPPNSIPKHQASGPIGRSGRVLASQLADAQTNKFVRDYMALVAQSRDTEAT